MKNQLIAGMIVLFSTMLYAQTLPEVIVLNEKSYPEHKKAIVKFEHKTHHDEYFEKYSDLYGSQCGDCHHDDKGNPFTELKQGDDVQKCIECHKIPSEAPKGKKAKVKLTKQEKIKEYHAEALHANCKGCHKQFNKKYKPKKAPTTCTKCHIKEK